MGAAHDPLMAIRQLDVAALAPAVQPREARMAAESFDEVYATWAPHVLRWVRAFGGLDADLDDLAQEVFIVVQRKLPAFDGRNLPAWLYSIAARTVSDHRRRAWFRNLFRRAPDADLASVPSPLPGPYEVLERRDAERALGCLLQRMSEKRRTVFILFEIEGYSGEEIARLQRIPVATVWTRLHHARRDLFALLEELRRKEVR